MQLYELKLFKKVLKEIALQLNFKGWKWMGLDWGDCMSKTTVMS